MAIINGGNMTYKNLFIRYCTKHKYLRVIILVFDCLVWLLVTPKLQIFPCHFIVVTKHKFIAENQLTHNAIFCLRSDKRKLLKDSTFVSLSFFIRAFTICKPL